jgi:hypothetical protein
LFANQVQVVNNVYTHVVEGEFDLSAAGAVTAVRGNSLSVTKTGVGTYVIRLLSRSQGSPALFELVNRRVDLCNGTPAGALGVRAMAAATDPTDSFHKDLLFTVLTTAGAGASGAAADTTAAITVSFRYVIRTRQPRN